MRYVVNDSRIDQLRHQLRHGQGITQEELDRVSAELAPAKDKLRSIDNTEALPLFDRQGRELGTTAPRWICHLLALRHRCSHILMIWRSPSLGDVLLLQIRDWSKDDSPGHVDISVGGHMTSQRSSSQEYTAFAEMLEETGLDPSDLDGQLQPVGGYAFDESRVEDNFHNSEWRDVYVARVRQDRFGKICFPDGEVAGLVLVPLSHARQFLGQATIPMASALKESLPSCLQLLERRG